MVVSQATVKTRLDQVLARLALEDRGALIAWAWRFGLVDEHRAVAARTSTRVATVG
jgi:hypothetical protein